MKIKNVSWDDVDFACQFIADQIEKSQWKPDYVYGPARGGLVPAVILSHRLGVQLITCIGIPLPYNLLIIDDINDTGKTLSALCINGPPDVKTAALVHNLASEFNTDFHAFEINKSHDPCWVVFPWEVKQRAEQELIRYRTKFND